MKNLANNAEYVWSKEKFRNNMYLMQEMYANFEDEDDWDLPEVRRLCGYQPSSEVKTLPYFALCLKCVP